MNLDARRILFVSFACYLDDSSGSSVASRAAMEALARRGFPVEVLCGSGLEMGRGEVLSAPIAADSLDPEATGRVSWDAGLTGVRPGLPPHLRLLVSEVPITVLLGPTTPHEPGAVECCDFLQLFEEAWARFRPDVVVSYGGGSLTREVLGRAKARGTVTVFPLHNLRYRDAGSFANADAVVVASHFAAEHYRTKLRLRCTVLPNLVDIERVRADGHEPTYVTFVNPTVEKGVYAFARIAYELGRRRPNIPFLVVEGRGTEADVASCGLDLRDHGNVFFLAHTADPRRFWRVTRLCLLPSLIPENQPLVAIEAMLNGAPVLGSDRGGVPETVGAGGLVLPLPGHLGPSSKNLPTAGEVSQWVAAILRLWEEAPLYEECHRMALAESTRWAPEVLEPRYERFFAEVRPGYHAALD